MGMSSHWDIGCTDLSTYVYLSMWSKEDPSTRDFSIVSLVCQNTDVLFFSFLLLQRYFYFPENLIIVDFCNSKVTSLFLVGIWRLIFLFLFLKTYPKLRIPVGGSIVTPVTLGVWNRIISTGKGRDFKVSTAKFTTRLTHGIHCTGVEVRRTRDYRSDYSPLSRKRTSKKSLGG